MKIFNATKEVLLADEAKVAETFTARLTGLLNRTSLNDKEALVIPSCPCIHMFFMKFPIDVIFVGKDNKVVGLAKNIKPFQVSPFFGKAASAIELTPGTIDATQTDIGDTIHIEN